MFCYQFLFEQSFPFRLNIESHMINEKNNVIRNNYYIDQRIKRNAYKRHWMGFMNNDSKLNSYFVSIIHLQADREKIIRKYSLYLLWLHFYDLFMNDKRRFNKEKYFLLLWWIDINHSNYQNVCRHYLRDSTMLWNFAVEFILHVKLP